MATVPSSTVLKAFQVLELFAERPLLGAAEAARMLGVPRASVHRLLVTLKAAGVAESTAHGQYRLGLRLFELGSLAPPAPATARPVDPALAGARDTPPPAGEPRRA
jgi:DNA-binding IclR family transcriptional regulator